MADKLERLIPHDALAYFDAKKITLSSNYTDVWRAEHAFNFTVAKCANQDILNDIHTAIRQSIADGLPYAQFQKNLTNILVEKGWWGKHDVTDLLTGENKRIALRNPTRLKLIYDTNIRTARSAGQWARIQRTKDALPYLVYQLGPSAQHRPEHVTWNGIVLPVDDSFWITHYPQNGYRCRCWVRQVSRSEYEKMSGDESYRTEPPSPEYQEFLNKRTGQLETVPKGIDPGWDINHGLLRQVSLDKALLDKSYPHDTFIQTVLLSQMRQTEYKSWVDNVLTGEQSSGQMTTVGLIGDAEAEWLTTQHLTLQSRLIAVEDRVLVGKKAERHQLAGNNLTAEDWHNVPKNLVKPNSVLFDHKNKTLLYTYDSGAGKANKLAVAIDFKIKPRVAQRMGLPDNLNVVRSGFKVTHQDLESNIKSGVYSVIKK